MSKEIGWWDTWNSRFRQSKLGSTTIGLGMAVLVTLQALEIQPRGRILEVGCGTGWFAAQLVDRWEYVGLDISPAAIQIARKALPQARFEACDFHEWTLPGQPFDAVVAIDTISAMRDQESAAAKIASALRPNGWAVLTAVNPFVYSRMKRIGPPGEGQARKWLTRAELHALLGRHSLVPVKSWTILPDGDTGILRWVNARKLNRPLELLVGETLVRRTKELLGLGQYRIVLARKVS